jgi:(p)ppGpp synthase/HD superfamily hydrolase
LISEETERVVSDELLDTATAGWLRPPNRGRHLLRCHGQPDEVIAAGLLHDVLEKTPTTRTELQRRFGARIAQLVEALSDNPAITAAGVVNRASRLRVVSR